MRSLLTNNIALGRLPGQHIELCGHLLLLTAFSEEEKPPGFETTSDFDFFSQ